MACGPGAAEHFAMFCTATAMKPLPLANLVPIVLLLSAAASAQADEPVATVGSEAVVAVAAASAEIAADRSAADRTVPPLVIDPREYSSSGRPARRWIARGEVDSGAYRMSVSRGMLDMGVGFEAPASLATSSPRSVDPSRPIAMAMPSLSIGLRSDGAGPAPSSLIERATAEGRAPSSTRRIGLEWKPAQSSIFVKGGVRLAGDDRITMRVKGGRVGVYMKSTF
jgi:hypothetical protein